LEASDIGVVETNLDSAGNCPCDVETSKLDVVETSKTLTLLKIEAAIAFFKEWRI